MHARWWEGVIGFICDNIWIILVVIVILVAVIVTRNYWLPLFA